MLVAVIADSHFDETPGGRFDECVRIHNWIADDMERRGVDLCTHSGDLYERRSTAREREAAAAWVQRVAEFATFVAVRGNHESHSDVKLLERLDTKHQVFVEEAAGVYAVPGAIIGCLAWPQKANVLAMSQEVMGRQEGEQVAGDALRNVLRGLGEQMAQYGSCPSPDVPRILLAHAMVRGSMTSTGQPLPGAGMELGLEDLALAGAEFCALGHIHKHQSWVVPTTIGIPQRPEMHIVYPGSPRRTAFGETEDKGYVLAEFDGPALVRWEHVITPCAPMHLWEADWIDGRLQFRGERLPVSAAWIICSASGNRHPSGRLAADVEGEYRIRFHFEADQHAAANAAAEWFRDSLIEQGASVVKLDPQTNPTTTARAPEVAEARDLEGKLRALWKLRGADMSADRAGRLLDMAAELEELG